MVIGESSTMPMAASMVAIIKNAKKVPVSDESSALWDSTCCQITESPELPGVST